MFAVSSTVDAVIEALGAAIVPFVPTGTSIIQADQNRVALPAGNVVVLTPISSSLLESPWQQGNEAVLTVTMPSKIDVQVDFYGADAGNWCKAVSGMFRTGYGSGLFPAGIAPLNADDGRQAPLTTGEQQYLMRWILTASLQHSPALTISGQESAITLTPGVIAADVLYQ